MRRTIINHLLPLALVFALAINTLPFASAAADSEPLQAANALHSLGLFAGTGTDESGNPIFNLDLVPTRHEAVTMLVRLLGKEDVAKSEAWNIPFTDVADWAKPYVGYAYASGLTFGTSETIFNGNAPVDAAQYLTFVLRALGYKSGTDFQWDSPWTLSDQIGLTNGEHKAFDATFTRGDVAQISYRSLAQSVNGHSFTLIQNLANRGSVVPGDALSSLLAAHGGSMEYYSEYPVPLPSLANIDFTSVVEHVVNNDSDIYEIEYKNGVECHDVANKYCDLLQDNGFSIEKSSVTYRGDPTYTATSSLLGTSFTIADHEFIVGEKWTLQVRIPMSDLEDKISFTLSDSTLTLPEGESLTLTATAIPLLPTATVSWESFSPSEHLKVEDLGTTYLDGKLTASARITALQGGNYEIYAWLEEDGSRSLEVCNVTVPIATSQTKDASDMHYKLDDAGKYSMRVLTYVSEYLNARTDSTKSEAIQNARFYIELTADAFEGMGEIAEANGLNDITQEAADQALICRLMLAGDMTDYEFAESVLDYGNLFFLSYTQYLTMLSNHGIKMPAGLPSDWQKL